MRFHALAATTLAALLTHSLAFAELPTTSKKGTSKKPVVVASAEPLPQLPAAEPQAAPATAPSVKVDAPASAPATNEPPAAGQGVVWGLAGGMTVLGGQINRTRDAGSALMTVDVKVGYYVTPHVGILAGLQGGYGASWAEGCYKCVNAFSFQLPVVVQYAFADRSRGAYLDGGLAFLTMYGAANSPSDGSRKSITLHAPVDVKLGAGYRFARGASAERAAPQALDLRFGLDVGRFTSIETKGAGAYGEGDIEGQTQALHYAFGFTIGSTWAP